MLTVADVEKLQHLYPDCQIELRDGAITIMSRQMRSQPSSLMNRKG